MTAILKPQLFRGWIICDFIFFRRQFSNKTTDLNGTEKSVLEAKADNGTDLVQYKIYDYYEAYNFLTGDSQLEASKLGKLLAA